MENLREIVNGKLLPQFSGKKVSLTGLVTNVGANGLSFDLKAVDDVNVKVSLKKPHQGMLDGYVEVHGISQGNSVICEELFEWKSGDGIEFDAVGHNSICELLNSVPGLWELE